MIFRSLFRKHLTLRTTFSHTLKNTTQKRSFFFSSLLKTSDPASESSKKPGFQAPTFEDLKELGEEELKNHLDEYLKSQMNMSKEELEAKHTDSNGDWIPLDPAMPTYEADSMVRLMILLKRYNVPEEVEQEASALKEWLNLIEKHDGNIDKAEKEIESGTISPELKEYLDRTRSTRLEYREEIEEAWNRVYPKVPEPLPDGPLEELPMFQHRNTTKYELKEEEDERLIDRFGLLDVLRNPTSPFAVEGRPLKQVRKVSLWRHLINALSNPWEPSGWKHPTDEDVRDADEFFKRAFRDDSPLVFKATRSNVRPYEEIDAQSFLDLWPELKPWVLRALRLVSGDIRHMLNEKELGLVETLHDESQKIQTGDLEKAVDLVTQYLLLRRIVLDENTPLARKGHCFEQMRDILKQGVKMPLYRVFFKALYDSKFAPVLFSIQKKLTDVAELYGKNKRGWTEEMRLKVARMFYWLEIPRENWLLFMTYYDVSPGDYNILFAALTTPYEEHMFQEIPIIKEFWDVLPNDDDRSILDPNLLGHVSDKLWPDAPPPQPEASGDLELNYDEEGIQPGLQDLSDDAPAWNPEEQHPQ